MTHSINQNDLYIGEKRPTMSAPELITNCSNNPINAYRAMLKEEYVVTPYRDYHEVKTLSRKLLDSKKKHKQKIAAASRKRNKK